MKIIVRMLALIMACLMCVVPVIACDEEEQGGNNGGLVNNTQDENGLKMDDLPSLNYLGETVNVLHWNDAGYHEFDEESITGDNVADAVYMRNDTVMSRLNIELNFIGEPGSNTKRAAFVKRVTSAVENSSHDFDIISSYSRTQGMLAVAGHLYNLNDLGKDVHSYINLNQPWWPADITETLSFGSSCYFLSGDISTAVLYNMTCVFFNKKQLNAKFNETAQEQGFESAVDMLYDMVYLQDKQDKTKNWTIDRMIEISNEFCDGVDNSGKAVQDGRYGFVSIYFQMDGFYTGSNLRLVDQDPEDLLVISRDFTSSKTVALVKKLGTWVTSETCLVETSNGQLGLDSNEFNCPGYAIPFMKQNALFMMCRAEVAGNTLSRLKNFSYGILPIPKYNDSQLNYYTCLGNPISIFGIFIDCIDPSEGDVEAEKLSMLTAVLECWASEGYRKTTPEIFYVNMMVKWSESPKEADMFQYVRNGIVFDLGRIFSDDLSYMSEMPSRAAATNSSWINAYGAYKNQLNKKMENMVESFREQGVI